MRGIYCIEMTTPIEFIFMMKINKEKKNYNERGEKMNPTLFIKMESSLIKFVYQLGVHTIHFNLITI